MEDVVAVGLDEASNHSFHPNVAARFGNSKGTRLNIRAIQLRATKNFIILATLITPAAPARSPAPVKFSKAG
jgi:hypothetical protein